MNTTAPNRALHITSHSSDDDDDDGFDPILSSREHDQDDDSINSAIDISEYMLPPDHQHDVAESSMKAEDDDSSSSLDPIEMSRQNSMYNATTTAQQDGTYNDDVHCIEEEDEDEEEDQIITFINGKDDGDEDDDVENHVTDKAADVTTIETDDGTANHADHDDIVQDQDAVNEVADDENNDHEAEDDKENRISEASAADASKDADKDAAGDDSSDEIPTKADDSAPVTKQQPEEVLQQGSDDNDDGSSEDDNSSRADGSATAVTTASTSNNDDSSDWVVEQNAAWEQADATNQADANGVDTHEDQDHDHRADFYQYQQNFPLLSMESRELYQIIEEDDSIDSLDGDDERAPTQPQAERSQQHGRFDESPFMPVSPSHQHPGSTSSNSNGGGIKTDMRTSSRKGDDRVITFQIQQRTDAVQEAKQPEDQDGVLREGPQDEMRQSPPLSPASGDWQASTPTPSLAPAPEEKESELPFRELFESARRFMGEHQWNEAAQLFQDYVQGMEQLDYGTASSITVNSSDLSWVAPLCDGYQHLGLAFFNMGSRNEQALGAFHRCYRLRLFYNLDTTVVETLIGSTLAAIGTVPISAGKFFEVVRKSVQYERNGDRLLLQVTRNLASTALSPGQKRRLQSAINDFQDALHLEETMARLVLHADTVDEATVRWKLASAYVIGEEPMRGFAAFRGALCVYYSIVEDGICVDRCLNGIRAASMLLGFAEADIEEYLDAVLMALVQESTGDDHAREVRRHRGANGTAQAPAQIKAAKMALQHYECAVSLEEIGLGRRQLSIATLQTKMANVYEAAREYQKAMGCHCHALALYEPSLGSDDPMTLLTKSKIETLLQLQQAEARKRTAVIATESAAGAGGTVSSTLATSTSASSSSTHSARSIGLFY
eukprot:CAMPEP_0119555432 /NCGR_PEP_ID=MMETSP1352-20130426/7648_1 /TAXON_ID=265584 /ORGANISM="Stauroneis constricta, Strain CCMP1120" /LENGTH=893 /DNA_ID=CAMNT_0007602191 /DNA_START=241 /DNA_END=2922 /DNA_ORIENTATION=+